MRGTGFPPSIRIRGGVAGLVGDGVVGSAGTATVTEFDDRVALGELGRRRELLAHNR
jgi:hypothetical protein